MEKIKVISKIIVIIFLIILTTSCNQNDLKNNHPKAKNGVLDLRSWDFDKNGPILLDGEWEFYWKKYLTEGEEKNCDTNKRKYLYIPGNWIEQKIDGEKIEPCGYATYRLKVLLNKKYERMGIKSSMFYSSYRMFINNQLLMSNGSVGKDKMSTTPKMLAEYGTFNLADDKIDIVILEANFHDRSGGFRGLFLGKENQVIKIHEDNTIREMFLIGTIFIMAFYHFGLFFLRRNDTAPFYFGLFCLLFVFRILSTGERMIVKFIPILQWEQMIRIEYITFYLAVPVFLLFVNSLYKLEINKYIFRFFLAVGFISSFSVVLMEPLVFTKCIKLYQYFTIACSVYSIYVFAKATIKKKEGAELFLVGFLFLFTCVVNDIFIPNALINSIYISPIGVLGFIFFQSMALAKRFTKTFEMNEKMKEAFAHFVPYEFLKLLKKESIVDIKLGDHILEDMTILSSDMRSFSMISEKMTPQENFDFINSYLERVGPIIRANNGFIDKYIGDAVMALFPKNVEDSINAAIEMQKELQNFNTLRKKEGYEPVAIGIGLHMGNMMIGTIGEENRMEATVISDAVNLAFRVESLTKIFGVNIIITGNVHETIKEKNTYNSRFLGKVIVKGKNNPISIYEVIEGADPDEFDLRISTKREFEKAVVLYHNKKIERANELFRKVYNINENDKTAQMYIEKCENLMKDRRKEGWDGFEKFN